MECYYCINRKLGEIHMSEKSEKYYTVKEAAKLLGMKEQTLRLWIKPRDKEQEPKVDKSSVIRPGKEILIEEKEIRRILKLKKMDEDQVFQPIDLIKECKSELLILGTNALSHLHIGQDEIKKGLERGIDVKILLLDPESMAFYRRSWNEESKNEEKISGRLIAELRASLAICDDIYLHNKAFINDNPEKKHGTIEVRFFSENLVKSFLIIDPELRDDAKCFVKIYPEDQTKRGIKGTEIRITMSPLEEVEFISYLNDFVKLWENKRTRQYEWGLNDIPFKEGINFYYASLRDLLGQFQVLKRIGNNLHIEQKDLDVVKKKYPEAYTMIKYLETKDEIIVDSSEQKDKKEAEKSG